MLTAVPISPLALRAPRADGEKPDRARSPRARIQPRAGSEPLHLDCRLRPGMARTRAQEFRMFVKIAAVSMDRFRSWTASSVGSCGVNFPSQQWTTTFRVGSWISGRPDPSSDTEPAIASRSSHRCQHASRRPAIITTNWNPSRLEFLRKTPVRH